MLLTNETLTLYPVQFPLIHSREISCIVNVQVWLLTHFFVILMIHAVYINIYIVLSFLYVVIFLLYPRFRSFIRAINPNIQLRSYAHERKYLYGIMLIIKEMLFVFVYVLFAFLYKWFGFAYNGELVTLIDLHRWLIEATCAPFLLWAFLYGYYMECLDIVFDEYQVLHMVGVALKIPLFFWMRYAESQPDVFLNHTKISLLNIYCKSISEDNRIKE